MKMRLKRENGITLVALIITIVILIILAAVTISSVMHDGFIDVAINGTQNYAAEQYREIDEISKLADKLNDAVDKINNKNETNDKNVQNYQIEIQTVVQTYNVSLGEVQVVYTVVGEYEGNIVFKDIVSTVCDESNIRENIITLNADLPEGTELTVTQVYSGGSYDLNTENTLQAIVEPSETKLQFPFIIRYNEKRISNSKVNNEDSYIDPLAEGNEFTALSKTQTENGYDIIITNIYTIGIGVRIKLFCLNEISYTANGEDWAPMSNGYWQYNRELNIGEETMPINIELNEDSKIIIVKEAITPIYDGDGNANFDWNSTY